MRFCLLLRHERLALPLRSQLSNVIVFNSKLLESLRASETRPGLTSLQLHSGPYLAHMTGGAFGPIDINGRAGGASHSGVSQGHCTTARSEHEGVNENRSTNRARTKRLFRLDLRW
eukprot:3789308-Amphidinium_carterae.1